MVIYDMHYLNHSYISKLACSFVYVDSIFCYFLCFSVYIGFWATLSPELKRETGWYLSSNSLEKSNCYNLILKTYIKRFYSCYVFELSIWFAVFSKQLCRWRTTWLKSKRKTVFPGTETKRAWLTFLFWWIHTSNCYYRIIGHW